MQPWEFEPWLRALIETACHPGIVFVQTLAETQPKRRDMPPGLLVRFANGHHVAVNLAAE